MSLFIWADVVNVNERQVFVVGGGDVREVGCKSVCVYVLCLCYNVK